MKKKDEIARLTNELLDDVSVDRERLTVFLDKLIAADADPVIIAEYVAKLTEALTRQGNLRVDAINVIKKSGTDDEETGEEVFDAIGLPFSEEKEDGSN